MKNAILMTDIRSKTTFVLEIWRRGSRTLHATAMPAIGAEGDRRLALGRVPPYIRRAAKAALLEG